MQHWHSFIVAVCLLAAVRQDTPAADDSMWAISIGVDSPPTVLTGRILAEIPGSALLIEERNGRQHQLTEAKIKSRTELGQPFVLFTPEELAADLLQQVPAGFEIAETDHYVVCSNSSSDYVDFCGRLLESVFSQYFRFMTELKIPVQKPSQKLPVVIFASAAEFQAFALEQHPEISFADTPGYFSVSDNQTLLLDLTGDRSIRSRDFQSPIWKSPLTTLGRVAWTAVRAIRATYLAESEAALPSAAFLPGSAWLECSADAYPGSTVRPRHRLPRCS